MKRSITLFLLVVLFLSAFNLVSAQKKKVTFRADMRMEVNKGTFNPLTDKVTVPGAMNNWLNEPPANDTKVMQDPDGDKIYELSYDLDPGTYDYKFNIGLGWEGKDEPGDNSKVTVGNQDVTVTRFFKGKAYTGIDVEVTFNVNMKLPIQQGFNPTTGKVYVAGNFTDWGTGAIEMADPDKDSIYTLKKTIKSGELLVYKFIHSPGAASSGTWESPSGDDVFGGDKNRQYGVVDGENVINVFWENKDPNVKLADGAISFYVDMSVLEELGVYNPAKDKLQVRGAFNGWSGNEPEKSHMVQDPLFPSQWFLSVPFVKTQVNSEQPYKFYANLAEPGIWTDGWERPLSMGGGNRVVPFLGQTNQETEKVYYDDVHPAFVIPGGQTLSIKFRVDMSDAFDPTKIAIPMTKDDKLYWINEQPLFTRLMGWTDTDEMKNLELTDPDGDKIYEGTLTVNSPGFNAFEYRYGFVRASDNSWKIEEAGFGKNAYRVRYVAMTDPRKFVQPYTAPLDKWSDRPDKSDQVEDWPQGLSSIRDLEFGIPTQYTLEQNYPNPFNPATIIRFSIPQDQKVSLKVFNVLGQEVATLLNQEMKAGSYEVDFNASKLSSGIYFYTIKAGSFSSTKKMLFLK